MKQLISVTQLQDKTLLEELFTRADYFAAHTPDKYSLPLKDKLVATLFFEPSTRTRLSFEAAAQRLGGQLLSVENADEFSSVKKGESLEDTIRTVSMYADGIVMRHPEIGSSKRAAAVLSIPFINAGDGAGDHPTQALLDVYSIQKFLGHIDGLKVALVGDLAHSRTHRALLQLLSIYTVELYLISPKVLAVSNDLRKSLKKHKIHFHELESWQEVIGSVDVLYMNRIQQERFATAAAYEAVKDSFCLQLSDVKRMKKTAIILDPLPRVNEIDKAVDTDLRARYFEQVKNGLFVRMALLEYLFHS